MKNSFKIVIVSCFLTSACATNTKSRWTLMGVAAPVGGVVGYSTAPDDEKPAAHAFLWSAAFTAVAAIIGNYYFSDSKEIETLRAENNALKSVPKFEVITEGKGQFTVPGDSPNAKKSGVYKIKKIDLWVDDGPNTKIHQDLRIEKQLEPASKKESKSAE